MKINIFEGGRRIAVAISAIASIIVLFNLFSESSSLPLYYKVSYYGLPVEKNDGGECPYPNRNETDYRTTADGKEYYVRICFSASKANGGEMLIPYKEAEEKGMYYMASGGSDVVDTYAKNKVRSFELPPEDMQSIDLLYYKHKIWEFSEGVGYLAIGLAIFWTIISIIGWVVRGFLGIPRGHDRRPVSDINAVN